MNFTILFALANLSFDIEFKINPFIRQDFLFFEGENSSAHLFRENDTVFLKLASYNIEFYKCDITDKLEFTWEGYKVNGTAMQKFKSSGNVTALDFDAFTVLSPILNIQETEEKIIASIVLPEKVNYYYILLIVLALLLLMDIKPRLIHLLLTLINKNRVSADYETMKTPKNVMSSAI